MVEMQKLEPHEQEVAEYLDGYEKHLAGKIDAHLADKKVPRSPEKSDVLLSRK